MFYNGVIKGQYVQLSSVTEKDAEFTLKVRQDERLTRFLPPVKNTIEQQREWILAQQKKEGDYYFVARDYNSNPVGTVGIYDIENEVGEGGRLTSIGDALQSIEIQYLILKFDFEVLKLKKVTAYVYAENSSAYRLSEKMGMQFDPPTPNAKGELICNGSITKEQFDNVKPNIERMLYRKK